MFKISSFIAQIANDDFFQLNGRLPIFVGLN